MLSRYTGSVLQFAQKDCHCLKIENNGRSRINYQNEQERDGISGAGAIVGLGACGLSLVAGYYRIAADPAQLSHQLALTGRKAQAEDIVRGANILQLKSRILRGVTAKRLGAIPYPAILGLKEGGFAVLGVGSTKGRRA